MPTFFAAPGLVTTFFVVVVAFFAMAVFFVVEVAFLTGAFLATAVYFLVGTDAFTAATFGLVGVDFFVLGAAGLALVAAGFAEDFLAGGLAFYEMKVNEQYEGNTWNVLPPWQHRGELQERA